MGSFIQIEVNTHKLWNAFYISKHSLSDIIFHSLRNPLNMDTFIIRASGCPKDVHMRGISLNAGHSITYTSVKNQIYQYQSNE